MEEKSTSRNFAWGEEEPTVPAPPLVTEPRRLRLVPLEVRLAPNVAWGE